MLYLLDANVLIDANRDYYPIVRVPEFWAWLVHMGENDRVKIPVEVYDEIRDGDDDLALWAKEDTVEQSLLFQEEVQVALVSQVTEQGYAADLSDDEIEKIGRDPFLIAYALIDIERRIVVTTEVSKPARQRANRHVPDVCNSFNVQCRNTFQFVRELDFSTSWRANQS